MLHVVHVDFVFTSFNLAFCCATVSESATLLNLLNFSCAQFHLMVGLALATPGEPSQLWDHPRAQLLHLQQERPRSFGTTIHQRNALRRQAGVKYSPLLVKYSPLLVKYWPAVCPPAGGELEEGWELEKESRETWKSHKMICLRKLKRKHKKECIADRDSITGRKYQTLDTEVPDPAF